MLLAGAGLVWLLGTDEFELDRGRIAINELHYTDAQVVHSTMRPWLEDGSNVFLLPASRIERALGGLPAVARAEVRIVLPDRLVVSLLERVPVFVWRSGGSDYLVDGSGVLLREVLPDEPLPADLPLVDDGRRREAEPQAGDVLEPADLAAILKLGAVDPSLLESDAEWLSLSVEQADGYVLTAEPGGWRAVFGHYTPTLRPPDIIERQVQCLRALVGTDEDILETVYLSPVDERCGTYVARATPEPGPSRGDDRDGDDGEGDDGEGDDGDDE